MRSDVCKCSVMWEVSRYSLVRRPAFQPSTAGHAGHILILKHMRSLGTLPVPQVVAGVIESVWKQTCLRIDFC